MSLEVYPIGGPAGPPGPSASIVISAGTTSDSLSRLTFADANGVTFGYNNSTITASVNAGGAVNFSAGTTSSFRTDITFSNSNGVSFGLDTNGIITATVQTNYLTTAMLSNRGSDFVQATAAFHGTNASGTINSNNISISVAAPSAASFNISAGTTSSNVTAVTFSNGSGVSFGFDGTNITATVATNYQSPGAYLTTAMQSNAATISNINVSAGTTSSNVSAITFSNGNGVSFGYDGTNITATVETDYLTTAMASNRGSDFVQATAAFHGTNASGTINSNNISVSVAAQSAQSFNISAGTTSSNVTAVTFSNANGVSFGYDGTNVSATVATNYQSIGAYLTTAALSGDTSKYVQAWDITGNTAGTTSSAQGTLLHLSGGNNVTISGSSNSIVFSVGNYLTTAALSQDSSKYAGTSTGMTGGSVTLNTSGIAISLPAYLTTAMQSNAATISNIKISAGASSSNVSAVTFSNSNGVSFGYDGTVITATVATNYQSQGAYLTTAALSGDTSKYVQAWDLTGNTAGTTSSAQGTALHFSGGNSLTVSGSSNTIVFSVGNYLTTAALSGDTSKYAGVNGSVATTAGTDLALTLNTSGATIGYPKWITTYVNDLTSQRAGTNTSVVTTSGTDLSFAVNTSGVTIAYPKWITAAAAAPITFSASNTSYALNTIAFSNSNGVSFGLGAAGNSTIMTATVATNYAGTGFTTSSQAGKNISATLDTNGMSMLVPAYATIGLGLSNSQTSFNSGVVALSEGGGAITIASSTAGLAGQSFMFSVPQTSSLAGVSGIGVSTNGSTISIYQSAALSYFENMPLLDAASTTLSASGSVLQVIPFILPEAISAGFLRVPVSMSYVSTEVSGTTANSTWSVNRSYTDAAVIMSQNNGASSLSLAYVTSFSASWLFQNSIGAGAQGSRYTVTQNVTYPISGTTSNYTTSYPQSSANVQISSASMTLFTGPRWLDIPVTTSISGGNYWLVLGRSTNSAVNGGGNVALGGASAGFSYIGASQNNLSVGFPGAATNSSIQLQPGLGSWSTNAAAMSTSSIGLASVSAMSSGPKVYFQMIRFA